MFVNIKVMPAQKNDPSASSKQRAAWYHLSRRRTISLLVIAMLVAVGVIAFALWNNLAPAPSVKSAHPFYADSTKNVMTLTDSAAKVTSTIPYPPNAYVNYEAVAPDGGTLLSLSITTSSGGFIFIKNGKAQTLSDEAIKILRSAIVLDSSHRVSFTGDNTVVLVICGSTCKLVNLNLLTGKTVDIVDSGVAPSNVLAPVYPLGISTDAKSVYLRVIGANKLGKENGALYKVDLNSHNILRVVPMSQDVGYTLSLSPNKSKLIYKLGGNGSPVSLHVMDVASGEKTTANWDKGDIADQPSAFHWSPDSSKILFQTINIILPPDVSATSAKPIVTAYLDVPKMTVTELQSFNDPSHHNIPYQAWLNISQVIYELDTSSKSYDFTKPDIKVYSQDISSKKTTNLPGLGRLTQVVYW